MIGKLLLRGLAAGLLAGVLAGGFAFAFGEPQVDRAIAVEEAASGHEPEHATAAEPAPPASRDAQRVGLIVASALYGTAVGGLFALAFALVRGRTGARGDWSMALWLAGLLFVALVLVPAVKYPPNPPGVGDPNTIGARTALYLTLLAISLLALVAAWRVARQLPARMGTPGRQLASAGVFAGTIALAMAVLPGAEPPAPGYPADLLWSFRVSALGTQVVMWASLGAAFGLACERAAQPRARRAIDPRMAGAGAMPDEP